MSGPMKFVVVGSGTVVPTADRVCSGYWIEAVDRRVLLDCGPGTLHSMARLGLPWDRLDGVVFSHFHTDHLGGLPALLFALKHGMSVPREAPLTIVGPPGIGDRLRRLAAAFGDYVLEPGFPLRVLEAVDEDGEAAGAGSASSLADSDLRGPGSELWPGLRLRCAPVRHTPEAVGWRVDAKGTLLGYTGDTGYEDAVAAFFREVDLLVAECSLPEEDAVDSHLTPERVARLARGAEPGRLLLTHVYPQLAGRDLPALIRRAGWDGRVEVAWDGLEIEVQAERPPR